LLAIEEQSENFLEKAGPKRVPAKMLKFMMDKTLRDFARDEGARKRAMAYAAKFGVLVVPYLIKHGLAHEDKAVQLATMETLENITGRSFGLKPKHTDKERAEAIKKWVAQWEEGLKRATLKKPDKPKKKAAPAKP